MGLEQRAVFVFLQKPALLFLISLFAYPSEELYLASSIFFVYKEEVVLVSFVQVHSQLKILQDSHLSRVPPHRDV